MRGGALASPRPHRDHTRTTNDGRLGRSPAPARAGRRDVRRRSATGVIAILRRDRSRRRRPYPALPPRRTHPSDRPAPRSSSTDPTARRRVWAADDVDPEHELRCRKPLVDCRHIRLHPCQAVAEYRALMIRSEGLNQKYGVGQKTQQALIRQRLGEIGAWAVPSTSTQTAVPASNGDGFDWNYAGIGVASAAALLLGAAGLVMVRRHHHRPLAH